MDAATSVAHILTDAGLSRVFRPRLPQSEAQNMPRQCVIVRRAGGGALQDGYMPTVDIRVDIRCYGANDVEAMQLGEQVARILHNVRDVTTPAGRVMWCRTAGAISDQTEPSTGWPMTFQTWQVYGPFLADGFGLGQFGTQTFGD
jgi:hypothetical protein